MSRARSSSPPVPAPGDPLVSRLRDLLLPLLGNQYAVAEASPQRRSAAQLLHHLFRESGTVEQTAMQQVLPGETIDLLAGAGLLEIERGEVSALFKVQTIGGLLFLADLSKNNALADHVLPIGAAGRFMARLAIRKPVGEALDIGCGTGIQALLACQHARHVTATDINPRALALTTLNARLNGIDNLTTLQGSLLEPVGERCFDLIQFNAPYILSPLKERPHSHAGVRGDAYLYELLPKLPAHMNEGGFAHIVSNWVHRQQEPWWTPLEPALTGLGLDALVLCQASLPVRRYADYWLKFEVDRQRQPLRYALTSMRWRAWYRRRGIERIGFGSLTMRRRSAPGNWVRFEKAGSSFGESLSDQLQAIFHNQDRFAAGLSADALISCMPRLINQQVSQAADGHGSRLQVLAGQTFPLQVRQITLELLPRLDGRTLLGAAIQAEADRRGLPCDKIRPAVLEDIASLARFGWIEL